MLGLDFILKTIFPKFYMEWGGGDSGGGDSGSSYNPPAYQASEYDAPSAKTLYGFYEPRVRGENLGYSQEDLGTMTAQAEDQATRQSNELIRRGSAGRRLGYGGTSTGGQNRLREQAIQTGLEYRSNAMRDIAIKNAVQKHQDQWNAATGLQNFLNAERSNALSRWTGDIYQYNSGYGIDSSAQTAKNAQSNQLWSTAGQIGGSLLEQYLNKNMYKTNQGYEGQTTKP